MFSVSKCNIEMDLELVSPNDQPQLNKSLFYVKDSRSNGLMLQISPSFIDSHTTKKKCRFLHCSFSEKNLLAVSDANGNVYIIDLDMQKYWQIPHVGTVSALSFPQLMKCKLLIALNTGTIEVFHIETGIKSGILIGHSVPAKEISYSSDGKYCLTSNSAEAIIWDLLSCSQAHKLSLKDGISLKKALFMPVQDSIFACFEDDTMHIWKFGSFECVKQVKSDGWRTHHLKSVAFTKNGRAMAVGGCTPNIIIYCLDTWTVRKVIELPDRIHGVKHLEFLPQIFDGGASKILGIVSNSSEVCFLDTESSFFFNHLLSLDKLIAHFSVSPTGKYLAAILISGEVNVYITQKIFVMEGNAPVYVQNVTTPIKSNLNISSYECGSKRKKVKQKWVEELNAVHEELRKELTLKKLTPILKQFGEYPDSYRPIIWRTILQLPLNKEAYISLAGKECHPSYVNIESKYPLVNRALSNVLKRILSCLAYWCPLFSEVTFLPEFVFPFVKLLHLDPFVCFESVTTIIVNWCQNWFEFYPFPPINVLSIIENILAYHDPDLLEFYYRKNVTSCLFACILMQTAFSEVLTKTEWLRLWDHILSNEPSFIFMAIVSYNIVCRNLIKNCETSQNIESFFHYQNAIDLKLFISKSYYFMDKTPPDIHPRQYLAPFSPLEKGNTYVSYEAYPKLILDKNATKLHLIQEEEEKIIQEQRKAIAMKKELDKKLRTDQKAEFREEVLTELDEKFRQIVNIEEERLLAQRRKLQNLRHELKLKELSVLEEIRNQILKKKSQKKEIEMERLLQDIEARKARENQELEAIEEEIRKYYSSLCLHKYKLKLDLEMKDNENMNKVTEGIRTEEDKLKEELNEFQDEIAVAYNDNKIAISDKIATINEIVQKIEAEIAQEMCANDVNSYHTANKAEMQRLREETESVEKKLETVMNKWLIPKNSQNAEAVETRNLKEKYSTCSEQIQSDIDDSKEKTSSLLIDNDSNDINPKKREESITYPRFWDNMDTSYKYQTCEIKKKDRHSYSQIKNSYCIGKESGKIKTKATPVTKAKLRSIYTTCSDIRSPRITSGNYDTSYLDSTSGSCVHDLSGITSVESNGSGNGQIGVGPSGDVKPVSGSRKCENCSSVNLYPVHLCISGSSSCSSDRENLVMKMALSERRKLVEEAKRYQLNTPWYDKFIQRTKFYSYFHREVHKNGLPFF